MLTEEEANELGYEIVKGAYKGTNDNRIDRYYFQRIDSDVVDRRGRGYKSKKKALKGLELKLKYIDNIK